MSDVKAELSKIFSLQQQTITNFSEGQDRLNVLAGRIKNGESTGDRIQDYLVVRRGILYPSLENKLREFQQSVAMLQDQQVLYIERYERAGMDADVLLHLGYLKGNISFDLDSGDILLPTKKYVERGGRPSDEEKLDEWLEQDGSIRVSNDFLLHLDKDTSENFTTLFRGNRESEAHYRVLLGPREVELYFSFEPEKAWEILLARESGNSNNSSLQQVMEHYTHLDPSYFLALSMLGRNPPQNFRDAFDVHFKEEQEKTLENLYELSAHMGTLTRELKMRAPGSVDDDTAVFYANMAQREQITSVRKSLVQGIERALTYGLHKATRTVEVKSGVILSLPIFVTELCREYNVGLKE